MRWFKKFKLVVRSIDDRSNIKRSFRPGAHAHVITYTHVGGRCTRVEYPLIVRVSILSLYLHNLHLLFDLAKPYLINCYCVELI